MNATIRIDWITAEYRAKLTEFAAEHEVPRSTVEAAFRDHCETFQSAVVDGTSDDVVRNLGYRKLQWHPPEADESTSA